MKKNAVILCLILLLLGLLSGCGHTHVWSEATCTAPKTCSECGEIEGEPLGHSWKEATCTAPKTCSRCGATEGKALGHDWAGATCTAPKTCSRCGQKEGNALGHDAPGLSCTESAVCKRCGEEVPALGHDWKNANCTEPKTCSRCGITEGEATGHKPAEPKQENKQAANCTESGRCDEVVLCSVCKTELSRKTVTEPALGHQVSNGTCTRCGEKITVTLYEDASVKITFKNAKKSEHYDDRVELTFSVENKTGKTLLIQADAVALNGYCFCDLVMSDHVPASSIGKVELTVEEFDFGLVDISKIRSIGGQFRIIDDTSWDSYKATFTNVMLDGSGVGTAPTDFSNGNLLYEDGSCAIYYKSIRKSDYYDDEAELFLFLYNKTGRTLLIQADAISVNGYGFSSLVMSDPVLSNTIGSVNVTVEDFDFSDVDINRVTSIGGQLRIIDDASMSSSYKATLRNSAIK